MSDEKETEAEKPVDNQEAESGAKTPTPERGAPLQGTGGAGQTSEGDTKAE